MRSERVRVRVADIASRIAIGPFGSRMKSELYTASGVPVIRGTNLTGGKHFSGDWVYVSKETADDLISCNVVANDLVFPHRGSIGEVGLVPDGVERYVLSSSLMTLRCNLELADPSFIYYFFKSSIGKFELLKNSSQVGTPGIGQPLSSLRSIEIALPPIEEQRSIARILGALDDKIELNRRTNETLGAMARALFKSWFVDFDGVAESELIESELGLIPRGWRVGVLGDVLALRNERVQPSDATAVLPYVPIECIGAKDPFLSEWQDGSEAKSSLTLFKRGDILFGAMRPYFHKVCLAPFDGVTRTTVFALKAKTHKISAYGLMLAFQAETIEYATLHSEGSTIPYAKWKDSFEKMPIVLPPEPLQERFGDLVLPLVEQAEENIQQSRTLAQLRDALLPELLSGELRVDGAEVG